MLKAPAQSSDPFRESLIATGIFALLCLIRLTLPSHIYFDEVHYVPAAKIMLEGGIYVNREHPLLGKELIALGIAIFGDNPMGWRIMPLLAGATAFFAMMRAMWFASNARFATLTFGFLIATGFFVLIHARLAMLDIFMVAFLSIATWQFSGALREAETAHKRLLFTGLALGAAMASKWNAIPLAVLPGIVFFIARISAGRERFLTSVRGSPIPGVSLLHAFAYLGVLPLLVYAATFTPALWFTDSPLVQNGLIGLHQEMLELQSQVLQPHNYESHWYQWIFNARGIWYLYELADDAQRGVLLIGNPVSMLLGLPAIIWCAYNGVKTRHWAKLGVVIGYAVSLGLWMVADKSVQFYYHYFLPSTFMLGALALTMDDMRNKGEQWLVAGALVIIGLFFVYFYPILTAAELSNDQSFLWYAWIDGWQ